MEEITSNVAWLAVIVGAVLSFLVGWLWYSPMLGHRLGLVIQWRSSI